MGIVFGIIVGIVVMALLFKPIFKTSDHFRECLRYAFTPDLISMFRGEYGEDWFASMKIGLWVGVGILSGIAVNAGVGTIFGL